MDWQLVASYFTVKSTDIFTVGINFLSVSDLLQSPSPITSNQDFSRMLMLIRALYKEFLYLNMLLLYCCFTSTVNI